MITITESVDAKVADILREENDTNISLRVFVQGGGCSGMQYGFALEKEQNEDDFVFEQQGVKYLVDAMSMQYLQGAVIDYKEDLEGANFVIKNPNAQTSCGCGSSFGI
jgi:iron-sulfur cluster insertion protein